MAGRLPRMGTSALDYGLLLQQRLVGICGFQKDTLRLNVRYGMVGMNR